MPSTYSPSLGIELIGNGEQAGTWGTTTNNNLGTLIEQAIAGVQPITLTGNYTLTDFNGLPDESRNAVLVFNGSLGAPANVTAPAVEKVYIVRNVSGNTVTVKTSSGNGVALTNAASAVIFCDGTDFYSATTLNFIDGNLTVTGTATIGGAFTANSSVTLKGDVFANSNTGQMYIPVGTTGQRTGSPINGVFRYNSTLNVYEGYANGEWVNFQTYAQASYTISYLVIAGGGGGSRGIPNAFPGAGGGAGGYLTGTVTFTPGTTYTMTVGAGGTGGTFSIGASQGSPSNLVGVTTTVGGGQANSGSGGSGGGGGDPGGIGTAGQGNNGGSGLQYGGGGGGGAGGVGANAFISGGVTNGGAGGVGLASVITGVSTFRAGGGGGAAGFNGTGGAGGAGGGGNGGVNSSGGAGQTNTGSGGGGGGIDGTAGGGGNGGSGVIIISMPTVNYTGITTGGPTVTTSGPNTILTFITSGTYSA